MRIIPDPKQTTRGIGMQLLSSRTKENSTVLSFVNKPQTLTKPPATLWQTKPKINTAISENSKEPCPKCQ